MVWAGSAQEDHASGETGLSSDGTFWQITSVLNTGAGPSPARTRSLRARPCKRAPACPELSRPSRLRRSHLQRSTRRSPPCGRVIDRGQRPLPELVEQCRLILPALEMATGWRASKSYACSMGMIKLAEAPAVGLAAVTAPSTVA